MSGSQRSWTRGEARRVPRATGLLALGLLLALLLPGCALVRRSPSPQFEGMTDEVHRTLSRRAPAAQLHEAWERYEGMGPELDPVLVRIARNPAANATARSNALVLLADRGAPDALPVLGEAVRTADSPRVRSGAIIGLQRLDGATAEVQNVIRGATADRNPQVRVHALQALDPMDVQTIRVVLLRERDARVRAVARQVLALAESRGAPLGRDPTGVYTTVALPGRPRLVFRPVAEEATGARGDLALLMTTGHRVQLARGVVMVGEVLPAFFSPDYRSVVFEAYGELYVRSLRTGVTRRVGAGLAPRPIPLSQDFAFVREIEPTASPAEPAAGEVVRRYEVFRAGFAGGGPESLGELEAVSRGDVLGGYSPVRWMVVADVAEGFVLRGDGVATFVLPNPFAVADEH